MKRILLKSYAKINICLDIKGKTPNGYHDLDMIMVPISLHDSIELSLLPPNAVDNLVSIDDFSISVNHYNLATRAIDVMAEKYRFKQKFRASIHKVIPIQAGLGGGSSNAAFTMKGVNELLHLNATAEEMENLCKTIGSDVPFFVKCQASRCKGVGDILTPVKIKNTYYVLIVKPNFGCPTGQVFSIADDMVLKTGSVDSVVEALETGNDELLEKSMFNSLQDPAIQLHPEIQDIISILKDAGLKMVQMSGSGSTVFALSRDKRLLKKVGYSLLDKYTIEIASIIK